MSTTVRTVPTVNIRNLTTLCPRIANTQPMWRQYNEVMVSERHDRLVTADLTWAEHRDGRSLVTVAGDLDEPDCDRLTALGLAVIDFSEHVEFETSAIGIFGTAALRSVEALRAAAAASGVGLRFTNRPPHVQRVLDVFEIEPDLEGSVPPPDVDVRHLITSADFDRVIAHGVLQGREAVVVTTTDLAPPGPEIVFVNRAFTDLTGYSADEVIGGTPRVLQGPLSDRRTLDRLRRDVEAGHPFSGETVNYRQDGTPFSMNWRVIRVAGSDDRPDFLMAMQTDTTELRRLTKFETAITYIDSQAASMTAAGLDDDERNRRMFDVLLAAEVSLMDGGSAVGRMARADGEWVYSTTRPDPIGPSDLRLFQIATGARRVTEDAEDALLHIGVELRPHSTFVGGDIVLHGMHRDRLALADERLHRQLARHASERAF